MDLHYSHKTEENLTFCAENQVALVFVPAQCTDVLQECDTVVNKPFKTAMKTAFAKHTHEILDEYLRNGGVLAQFKMKLTMGVMKPYMYSFVDSGVKALRTPEMKQTIASAFVRDGRYQIARAAATVTITEPENFDLSTLAVTIDLSAREDFEQENFDEDTSDSGSDL